MPAVLFVTDHIPGRDAGFQQSGHGRYLQTFIDFFVRNGYEITLLVVRPKIDFVSVRASSLPYRIVGPAFGTRGGRTALISLSAIARCWAWHVFARLPDWTKSNASAIRLWARQRRGFSHDLGRALSAAEQSYVREYAARAKPDVVIYDGIFNACGRLGDAEHWIVTHEVKYQRALSFVEHGVDVVSSGFDRESERAILESVGNVIAIQWDDANEFRRFAPGARVVVVPVAIDVPKTTSARAPAGGRCLFVGSGSYHNYDGIGWFLRECWPTIRARVPNATLDVVGTVCYRLGYVPEGVFVLGVVDDVGECYRRSSVAVVPLRMGSGLKVKIVEALAHGIPVITTSIGAQGLTHFEPLPFALADGAAAFSECCIDVLQDEGRQAALETSALSCADRFTPSSAFRDFAEAVRSASTVP